MPGCWTGAAQFRSHRLMVFSAEYKDRIAAGVGIEIIGVNQGVNQCFGKRALTYQVARDSG